MKPVKLRMTWHGEEPRSQSPISQPDPDRTSRDPMGHHYGNGMDGPGSIILLLFIASAVAVVFFY